MRWRGRIVRRDGDVALLEARLFDPGGAKIAMATANARVIPMAKARDAVQPQPGDALGWAPLNDVRTDKAVR